MIACAAAGLGGLAGLEREAAADPLGVIVRSPADAPVAADVLEGAMLEAGQRPGIELVTDPFERARARLDTGAQPIERMAGFARARALAEAGWRAYLAVETEQAAALLGRARDAAAAVLDLHGGLPLYADILLRTGAVELQLGRAAQAGERFALAHALDAERDVSIAEFVPEVVEAYGAAAAMGATLAARVRIRVEPAAARIEVDGREAGQGAAELQLVSGAHVVVARAPGFMAASRVVVAAPGESQLVVLLEHDPEAAAARAGNRGLAIGMAAGEAEIALGGLLRYAELDQIILVAAVWRRGMPALMGQRCAGLLLRCTPIIEIGYRRAGDTASAARELMQRLMDAPEPEPLVFFGDARLVQADGRPRARGRVPAASSRGCRTCRSPWLWAGVGAVLASAGATWLLLRDRPVEPIVTFEPCEFGGCR